MESLDFTKSFKRLSLPAHGMHAEEDPFDPITSNPTPRFSQPPPRQPNSTSQIRPIEQQASTECVDLQNPSMTRNNVTTTDGPDSLKAALKTYLRSLVMRTYSAVLVILIFRFINGLVLSVADQSISQTLRQSVTGKLIKLDLYFIPVYWLLIDKEAYSYCRHRIIKWHQRVLLG